MPLLADTHVHLYPVHQPAALFGGAFARMRRLAPEPAALALCLTERHDCHAFRALRDGRLDAAPFTVAPAGPHALRIDGPAGESLHLIAGRQVNARERLEILALGTDADLPDGEPIADTIRRTRDAGALPVIAWAPGKWFFRRGRIVTALLEQAAPGTLLVGDSALRPTWWPCPDLMSYASLRGLKVIAGSDPLPVAGEERVAGSYATSFDADLDPADPAASLLRTLADPACPPFLVGRRGTPGEVWRRLKAYRQSAHA